MEPWSVELIEARVHAIESEYTGDEFVAAVVRFGREELDASGRRVLHDVLMKRANLPGWIAATARERKGEGWMRRMREGRLRRPPS